jgi:aldehyde dehydrogenase (NAD+)
MNKIIDFQRNYFNTGATLGYDFRINQLKRLRSIIRKYEPDILDEFLKDYNKSSFDVISTEIGYALTELNHLIRHLKKLMKPQKVKTSVINRPSKGYIVPEPYGVSLVVAPWNYPFNLSIVPLAAAMAAGNTVVLKLSTNTPSLSGLLYQVLMQNFPREYIYVTWDSTAEREALFGCKFDYIFYTGSPAVARELQLRQAQDGRLTPMTLELGGKSPCIVDKDADIDAAARRIVWGKYLNAGQTCVAPDHVYVERSVKDALVSKMIGYIKEFYYNKHGGEYTLREDFTYVVNAKAVERLQRSLEGARILWGGKAKDRMMEPTIIDMVTEESPVMREEIFGPVLPVLPFDDIFALVRKIKSLEKPLAFYFFGKRYAKTMMRECHFGGGCINDTIMHLTDPSMPFGGVGQSGMGAYHGDKSFETFSHYKSILVKHPRKELKLKYPPHNAFKHRLLRKYTGL